MLVGTSVEVFQVSAATSYKSVQEVIDYAKANPGKLNYYSVGIDVASFDRAVHGRDRHQNAARVL
jgi:tripartite-type tricarboxylate transporter receptor subunit TctC